MSAHQSVERDERTVAVENTSYKWGCIFLSFGLFIDMMYRAMFRHEAAWDLMALIIVGGAVCTIHQARQKILGKTFAKEAMLIVCLGGVISLIILAVIFAMAKYGLVDLPGLP